jgi:hypothetical protein
MLMVRLSEAEADRGTNRILMLAATYGRDYIGSSLHTFDRDTVLANGVKAASGTQLTRPVNLDGYWNVRSFANFGLPAGFLSSNLSLNGAIAFSRSPGAVNGVTNLTTNWTFSPGVVIASNVSESVDFTISYTGNYTIARNSLQTSLDANYFTHIGALRSTLTFWEDLVLRNEMSHTLTTGLSEGYDQRAFLWTVGLGLRFLAERRGELRFVVNDILNQQQNITRTITETYLEDTVNRVLPRYCMLTFTYTLR